MPYWDHCLFRCLKLNFGLQSELIVLISLSSKTLCSCEWSDVFKICWKDIIDLYVKGYWDWILELKTDINFSVIFLNVTFEFWWSLVLVYWNSFSQGNSVSTTKYDVLTFLPKGLFEQVNFVIPLMLIVSNFKLSSLQFLTGCNLAVYFTLSFLLAVVCADSSGGWLTFTSLWSRSCHALPSGMFVAKFIF